MDTIKRIILFPIPMSKCNLRCSYCYLQHRSECFQNIHPEYEYTPEHVALALSPERLGGIAYLNFCADGETLLTKNIDKYIYELVKQGHYAEIVSNMTITKMIDKIISWDQDILSRIEFKCSFHYLELIKKGLLETYKNNVNKLIGAGISVNIEITPCDDLIPYINDIKTYSMEYFGSLPHVTIARNDKYKSIEYLTDLPINEYDKIWSQFHSDFWKFKKSIFMKRRNEFCYAGDWMLVVNIFSGETSQCYTGRFSTNIFSHIDKPIHFRAIGRCKISHCYNGHMLLTLGLIPRFTNVKYGDIRNRKLNSEKSWLKPDVLNFFNTKLENNNREYSLVRKVYIYSTNPFAQLANYYRKLFYRKIK